MHWPDWGVTAPDGLFDLAINRAATTLLGLGLRDPTGVQSTAALAEWHARTRFARRVPLSEAVRCLVQRPGEGDWHWTGGPKGGWQPGRGPFP